MTSDTPENQEPVVPRMSTSRRRALKTGAGAILVPTIMTITARSAHAADYTTTAYRYGLMMGCTKGVVPTQWHDSPELLSAFQMVFPPGTLPAGYGFRHNVFFTNGMEFFVLDGGAKRPLVPTDWVPLGPPPIP